MRTRVLIAGFSTRAAAESAARSGFEAVAIDAFGDVDQHPSVVAHTTPGPYSPRAAVEASRAVECEAAVYVSGFENHPGAVTRLAAGRELWGNPTGVLRRVRDPQQVFRTFVAEGHAMPRVWRPGRGAPLPRGTWLLKPLRAGGGHGVRPWDGTAPIPQATYLQEFVAGEPGSVSFVAAGGHAVLLGISRQLIGDAVFGARGFQYAGSILSMDASSRTLVEAAHRLAGTAAARFGLVGVNGIDFVLRDGVPFPVEINPRWCASMELFERAWGISVFAAHAAACASGELGVHDVSHGRSGEARPGAIGKAFVFATEDVAIGDTSAWRCSNGRIRDVPRPGSRIGKGRPVCTVFAEGSDDSACYDALCEEARKVHDFLAEWNASSGVGVTPIRSAW